MEKERQNSNPRQNPPHAHPSIFQVLKVKTRGIHIAGVFGSFWQLPWLRSVSSDGNGFDNTQQSGDILAPHALTAITLTMWTTQKIWPTNKILIPTMEATSR